MLRAIADKNYAGLVPCTLYSGHYHFGVGALANSLFRNGFRGTMCIGYIPPLPPWAVGVRGNGEDTILKVNCDFKLHFIPWQTDRNLSLEKPRFLLEVLDHVYPNAGGALFFDADITVHGSWSFFESWLTNGVALCLDSCYPVVAAGHPWRQSWRKLATEAGYEIYRNLEHYVNSGFVGIERAQRSTLQCWKAVIDAFLLRQQVTANSVKFATRENSFVGDQDFLNAALMATSDPLSIIGLEGMDFVPAGYTMSHAIDDVKPWKKNFIARAMTGRKPAIADKTYWQYCDYPIPIVSSRSAKLTRIAIRVASIIGRFYSGS